jgi:hypothetical protein
LGEEYLRSLKNVKGDALMLTNTLINPRFTINHILFEEILTHD